MSPGTAMRCSAIAQAILTICATTRCPIKPVESRIRWTTASGVANAARARSRHSGASAGFANRHCTFQHPARQHLGPKARLLEVLVIDRFHDRVRDVEPGEIQQFARAELEAARVAQYRVESGRFADTFSEDAQPFGAISAAGVID